MKQVLSILIALTISFVSISLTGCKEKELETDESKIEIQETKEQEEISTEDFKPSALTITLKDPEGNKKDEILLKNNGKELEIEASYVKESNKNKISYQEFKELSKWFNHSIVPQSYSIIDAYTDLDIDMNYPAMSLIYAATNFIKDEEIERWNAELLSSYLLRYFNPEVNSYEKYGMEFDIEYDLIDNEDSQNWEFKFKEFEEVKAILNVDIPKNFSIDNNEQKIPDFKEVENKFIIKKGEDIILDKTIKSNGKEISVNLQDPVSIDIKTAMNQVIVNATNLPLGEKMIHLVLNPGRNYKGALSKPSNELIISIIDELMKLMNIPFDKTKVFINKSTIKADGEKVTQEYVFLNSVTQDEVLRVLISNSSNRLVKYEKSTEEDKED